MKYATTDPPELLAQTLYAVLVQSCGAVPYSVPLLLPNETPLGKIVLLSSQDVITPGPVILGTSGKSVDAVFFVIVRFSGI